jgi:hypothetical protein
MLYKVLGWWYIHINRKATLQRSGAKIDNLVEETWTLLIHLS